MISQLALHLNGCAPNGLAIPIHINHPVRCTDEDGDRAAGAALRTPIILAVGEGLEHGGIKILWCEHHARIGCEVRLRLDVVSNDHGGSPGGE